jgi:soluble lytic murein transglycosylase-like protein
MRICFSLACGAVLAAVAMQGATGSEQPSRLTSVVRSDQRTGKLVRSVVLTSRPVMEKTVTQQVIAPRVITPVIPSSQLPEPPASPVTNIDEAVERIAAQQSISPLLIHSVIKIESNYNPLAVSPKGALGLMQLVPSTARRFGVGNVFNPVENIQGGARYLRYLLNLYNGNYPLALAAYNAGEAAVARFGGVPPFRETQNYLLLVRKQLEDGKRAEAERQREKEIRTAETKPAGAPNRIREVVEADGTVRYVSR